MSYLVDQRCAPPTLVTPARGDRLRSADLGASASIAGRGHPPKSYPPSGRGKQAATQWMDPLSHTSAGTVDAGDFHEGTGAWRLKAVWSVTAVAVTGRTEARGHAARSAHTAAGPERTLQSAGGDAARRRPPSKGER